MRVCIVEHHPYGSPLRTGSHQIAGVLRRAGHSLTWVTHPKSLLHAVLGQDRPRMTQHADGVLEVCPRVIMPYVDYPGFGSLWWGRRWLDVEAGRSMIDLLGKQHFDLLWLSDFTLLPTLPRLSAEKVVFRFFDHLEGFRLMPASVLTMANEHQNAADFIIASSRLVQRKLKERGILACYVPNGADVAGLAPPRSDPSKRPTRVAYMGAFDAWLDVDTMRYWIASCPDIEFLLIGPCRERQWKGLPNVTVTGPVDRERLFELLGTVRVGLIPFRSSTFTEGVHPLKQYDYLAAGCAVLSSNLPEVATDRNAIWKYESREHGLDLLREMVFRDWDSGALFQVAVANRWETRLKPVFEAIGLHEAL